MNREFNDPTFVDYESLLSAKRMADTVEAEKKSEARRPLYSLTYVQAEQLFHDLNACGVEVNDKGALVPVLDWHKIRENEESVLRSFGLWDPKDPHGTNLDTARAMARHARTPYTPGMPAAQSVIPSLSSAQREILRNANNLAARSRLMRDAAISLAAKVSAGNGMSAGSVARATRALENVKRKLSANAAALRELHAQFREG